MVKKCCYFHFLAIIILSCIMFGCIGGASQKSIYYVFNGSNELALLQSLSRDQGVGVGPVKLPEYLNRPQIVTRQEQNLLNINEFHRWGDSLEIQITKTLIENLSTLLNTPNIGSYPWKRPFTPQYQIYINFNRFDGNRADSVKLDAVWRIVDKNSDKLLLTRRSYLIEPNRGKGYKPYVAAMNRALKKFSQEIAAGIVEILPE